MHSSTPVSPLVTQSSLAAKKANQPTPTGAEATASGPELIIQLPMTVVIEPQETLRKKITDLAAARGHDVHSYARVAEAKEKVITRQKPDFLLVRLDHTTAVEVLHLLQEMEAAGQDKPQNTGYVLALTNEVEPLERREAWLKCGVDDFAHFNESSAPETLSAQLAVLEHWQKRLLLQPLPPAPPANGSGASIPYEEIFHQSLQPQLLLSEPEGQILDVNQAALHLLGRSAGELKSKFLSLALPEIFDHYQFSLESLSRGAELGKIEVLFPRPQGPALEIEVRGKSITRGPSVAILLQLQHLLPIRKHIQTESQRSRLDASIITMRGVAREISDALTSVRGHLDLLSRQPFPKQESRDHVDDALQGLRRIEGFARKAVALSRLQGTAEVNHKRLSLKPLLEKATAFALLDGHCTPVLDIAAQLWPLEGDGNLITEAFLQLARNAARAMPPGGHLYVHAKNEAADPLQHKPAAISIILRDEGHGIATDDLSRIQDPFYSTWGREGLGLTTAAAIIRAHNGTLDFVSKPAEGTTVTVRLPVDLKHLLQADRNPEEAEKLSSRGPHRILFMDDDPQIRSLVQRILIGQGYAVYCTNDGEEAIQAYRKAQKFGAAFDLIIMDLDVRGGMGGVEATQLLKREFPSLKAILATGYVDDNLLLSHQDHGFLGVLLKPFEVERLLGLVGKLVGP